MVNISTEILKIATDNLVSVKRDFHVTNAIKTLQNNQYESYFCIVKGSDMVMCPEELIYIRDSYFNMIARKYLNSMAKVFTIYGIQVINGIIYGEVKEIEKNLFRYHLDTSTIEMTYRRKNKNVMIDLSKHYKWEYQTDQQESEKFEGLYIDMITKFYHMWVNNIPCYNIVVNN